MPRVWAGRVGRETREAAKLVDGASQALQFVFYAEFFFLEGGDPDFIPIRVRHFGFDQFFQFLMFFRELLDMPMCHFLHLFR